MYLIMTFTLKMVNFILCVFCHNNNKKEMEKKGQKKIIEVYQAGDISDTKKEVLGSYF